MFDIEEYQLVPAVQRKSPILALLLSVLFPGFGHLYIGLRNHAGWLIVCQTIALAVTTFGSGNLHAGAILAVLSLYCFAMADAYFAAREWNAGATSLLEGTNPRIAAVLNLLTKGFGYFYLGDRTKGIVCFIIIGTVQVILLTHTNVWTSILAISFQIAIAADGYRVARQSLVANHPELDHSPEGGPGAIERANLGGLQPVAASIFFAMLGTSLVIGYGVLRALSGHSITTMGALEQGSTGLLYRNASEHIELTVPESWEYTRPADTLAQLTSDDGSSIIVMEQYAIYAVESSIDANKADILKRHPDADISSSEVISAGHYAPSVEASFKNHSGDLIHQRLILRRRGFKIIFFIETWKDPEQRTILDGIEKTIQD